MSAIEYDIKMETAEVEDPLRMGDLENMRPLPRISVHAFCES
jgi:pilus assembly protein CpaE